MISRVFVYGTLKRTFHNSHILNHSEFIQQSSTIDSFTLFTDLYTIPYAQHKSKKLPSQPLQGELYNVTPETLHQLDILEGVPENRYIRKEIKLHQEDQKAFIYLLPTDIIIPNSPSIVHISNYTSEIHTKYIPPGKQRDLSRLQSWGGFE